MSAFVNHHHGAPASDPRPGREPRRCRRAALLPATRPVRTTAAIPSLVSAPVPAARATCGQPPPNPSSPKSHAAASPLKESA